MQKGGSSWEMFGRERCGEKMMRCRSSILDLVEGQLVRECLAEGENLWWGGGPSGRKSGKVLHLKKKQDSLWKNVETEGMEYATTIIKDI